ncbi:hypothetical protein MIND_00213300 [Mycena indigotica]|uniref:F-box domain-containing protein n=1 Tax=Mycena indigotica TaxID=2126181 RepID=A0A8H6WAW8_9AGAR|nr:uncharacterized protein MIND_00213300 [Mycena indigotica]KAF7312014.1 hypothetical protein MIND_00213300 [Mycena indigotica]
MTSSFQPALLNLLRQRLSGIDGELLELNAKRRSLESERRMIEDTLKGVVYRIESLPADILAEIFVHYVAGGAVIGMDESPMTRFGPPTRPAAVTGPLVLGAVCHTWRAVVLALPQLWAAVQIYTQNDFEATEKLLNAWLPRAKSALLDVEIGLPKSTHRVLPMLAPYSKRWAALSCGIERGIPFAGNAVRGRVPKLRRLELSLQLYGGPRVIPGKVDAFSVAPLLRDVHLVGFSPAVIELPWAQLTKLQLGEVQVNYAVDVLRLTPRVEDVTLGFDHDHWSQPQGPLPLRLPNLHTLKFDDEADFMQYLTLPALSTVYFTQGVEDPQQLEELIARSQCSIVDMTLISGEVKYLIDVLKLVPSLVRLRVKNITWATNSLITLFSRLISGPQQGTSSSDLPATPLVPKLREVTLSPILSWIEIPYTKLAQLVSQRKAVGCPLDHIELVMAGRPYNPYDDGEPSSAEDVGRALETLLRGDHATTACVKIRGLQNIGPDTTAASVMPPPYPE